ncbi:MAG TPA: GNAT family N-acetyltransferase [Phototrophicaceae bacterium]|nr:GNAT family N-acetyltransferase [Phototrophicaceae bacterium]
MITYTTALARLTPDHLRGFFVGWPQPPTPETHLRILQGSRYVVLARDEDTRNVVGFITAISDGISAAYIPYLEVLPAYQGQGIGSELVRWMLNQLTHLYMIDLICDDDLIPFYERFGLRPYRAMIKRNYDRQAGE